MSIFNLQGLQSLNLRVNEIDTDFNQKHKERNHYKYIKTDYTFDQLLQKEMNKEEAKQSDSLTLQGLDHPENNLKYSLALEKFYNNL